jgi:serine/threonine protein kinase
MEGAPRPQSPSAEPGPAPAGPDATVVSDRRPPSGVETSVAEIGRSLEGHSLGPYRLDKFVGGGGMGAVFRALDTTLDRVVAVKVLSRQQSNDDEMLRRFRNEAQSAARLDHENIGRVHAVGSDAGWHYIVFEYIDGTNLRDLVAQVGPMSVGRAIDVGIQVAEALEHACQRDVVHRDIKPSNIIITPAGRARVVDMGLARLHQVAHDHDLTVSGVTLGTFDYISPEQARDPRSADVRSDLYSLGCTMFFMLTGRAPFAEGTMVQKLLKHQHDAPPALVGLRPDVPEKVAAVVRRLMAKDPDDRFQRPSDLVADLVAVADEEGIELASPLPMTTITIEPEDRAGAGRLSWLVPSLGLLLLVGGLWLRTVSKAGRPAIPPAPDTAASVVTAVDAAAAETPTPRVWRVVAVPEVDADCGTVGEAVRQASDGDVIEVACEEPRDDGPFVIEGKRITIRAAAGMRPVLRWGEGPVGSRDEAACTIVSGALDMRDVSVRRAFVPAGFPPGAVLCLRGSSALVCDGVRFEMPEEGGAASACVRSEPRRGERQEIRISRTRVDGGEAVIDARGGGRIDLVWSEGRVVTPGRFLVAEGAPADQGDGLALRMTLEEGLFACGRGWACLHDSPSRPAAPRLRAFAKDCRILVPEGHAVLEQSGVGAPEAYRPAIDWIDAGSRYEGSGVWRRIDGAAERFDIDFASQSQNFNHTPRIESWPEAE